MGGYAGHIKHIYEANTTANCIIDLFDNIVWGNKSFTENMKDSIEDNRLYLTYSCGTVPTTTLKYEHPSTTPWSRW